MQGRVLAAVAAKLAPDQARPALAALLETIRTKGSSYERIALTRAVPVLAGGIAPQTAPGTVAPVLALLLEDRSTDEQQCGKE